MKQALRELFLATLGALAIERVLPRRVRQAGDALEIDGERVRPPDFERIVTIAFGKAAFPMARGLAALLPLEGLLVAPEPGSVEGLRALVGGHPYPDAGSLAAADAILDLLRDLTARDLVFFLVSGGGSALVEKPLLAEVTPADMRALHRTLVTSGMGIAEANVVRKHLSAVKGGRLAQRAAPARQVTLYVSDVPADRPSAVASGPTWPDDSTVAQCRALCDEHGLLERLPATLRGLLAAGSLPETPKPGDAVFRLSSWHCLLANEDGVAELGRRAGDLGWVVEGVPDLDEPEMERALARLRAAHPGRTVAVVSGGEIECPVVGEGTGGRNQAFVLRVARRLRGRRVAVLSAGTDGIDGNSPAAGAVADGETLARAEALGLDADDFERRSDSHAFFAALGDTIVTGPTGNNIRDLRALVAW